VGGADQAGHVNIMTAGMHHLHFIAISVDLGCNRCIGKPGFLRYRQPIHIGAHHHQRSGAILQDGNHPGATDTLGDVKSC